MKKILTGLVFILTNSFAFAQVDTTFLYTDTYFKTVKPKLATKILKLYAKDLTYVFETYNNKRVLQTRETYKDQELRIKEGLYEQYENGKLILQGSYVNNKKEGVFKTFNSLGMLTDVQNYLNGNRHGKYLAYWANGALQKDEEFKNGKEDGNRIAYYEDGKVAMQEVYENGKLIRGTYTDIDGKPTTYEKMEHPPTFPGGMQKFYAFLADRIRYPADAVRNNITGKVKVSFTITETGQLEDILVTEGVCPSIDIEAVRVMKLSPKWIPGMQIGKTVKVKYNIPISFNL